MAFIYGGQTEGHMDEDERKILNDCLEVIIQSQWQMTQALLTLQRYLEGKEIKKDKK